MIRALALTVFGLRRTDRARKGEYIVLQRNARVPGLRSREQSGVEGLQNEAAPRA